MVKHLLTLKEYSGEWINEVIGKAIKIKSHIGKYSDILKNKTLVMLFEKTSTRTRCSFEAGMTQLGGHAIFLDWKMTQLKKASLKDEIRCIEKYSDIIMARVFKHETLVEMAKYMEKPLINALSDLYHPCQIISDLMTIKEKKGKLNGLKLAYVGDGNNVCNSLIVGCKKVGMKIAVATPKGYEPKEISKLCFETSETQSVSERLRNSKAISKSLSDKKSDKKPDLLTQDPKEAVKDADIVYTDTWVSMGQEEEAEKRKKIFFPYQINKELMKSAKKDALFMHCLPAYRGYEVTNDVIDSKQSVVFEQAENRMHAQKAVILRLLGKI